MNKSKCQRCDSERLTTISAKCRDMCWCRDEWNGYEHDGYVKIKEIGGEPDGGDYVDFTFCRDCGQIQGEWKEK